MQNSEIKPFIKWVGGKRQLLSEIQKHYPPTIERYCEPFVGGGAVLFDILANCKPKEVLIKDLTQNLVNVYCQVRDNQDKLIRCLRRLEKSYISLTYEKQKEMYNWLRDKYNSSMSMPNDHLKLRNAALFIFLNKTGFNGLYRVNKSGQFNVPMGKYKNPAICDEDTIKNASAALQGVKITCGSYSDCISFIDENTFLYIDPPYRPISDTASFKAYDKDAFDDNSQRTLKKFVDECVSKGASFVLSNSDPKNVDLDDDFFDDLYGDYIIKRVEARRNVSCVGNGRNKITEILVYNDRPKQG